MSQQLRHKRRVVAASAIGTSIEWYDYHVYSLASALVIGKLFFPEFSPLAGTLAAFATFGVGFIARPFGGVLAGHFGDRIGRKKMLMVTLLTMGFATVGIGLLPTFDTIGAAAPVLLVVLRLLQGLSAGGEWGGAALMTVEHAPPRRRGVFGCFTQLGTPAGMLVANLVMLLVTASMPEEQFEAWGWRLPFLLGVVMVVVGFYIRRRVEESPAFKQVQRTGTQARLPVIEVLRSNPKHVLLGTLSFVGNNAMGYLFLAYLLNYTTETLGMGQSSVLTVMLLGMAWWLVTMFFFAAWSDRVGRKPVYLAGYALLVVWAVPYWLLVDTGSVGWLMLAVAVLVMGLSATYGPQAALFAEMFPSRVRYSGASLAYALGAVFGGGFAPFIAAALYGGLGTSLAVAGYMILFGLISFVAVLAIRLPSGGSLDAEDPIGDSTEHDSTGVAERTAEGER
ncbi:MAG: MFS transporter [Pseudonocardiaceae bacterium]|nr:MFS transporter [Pseudonocardiaceae bacterium]